MVRLTDRPGMTLGVYRGRKTTIQYNMIIIIIIIIKERKKQMKSKYVFFPTVSGCFGRCTTAVFHEVAGI